MKACLTAKPEILTPTGDFTQTIRKPECRVWLVLALEWLASNGSLMLSHVTIIIESDTGLAHAFAAYPGEVIQQLW